MEVWRRGNLNGSESFAVVWYVGNVRKRKIFADLESAKIHATSMVNSLSRGEAEAVSLSGEERLCYIRASQFVSEFDINLDTAAAEYRDAKRLLKGGSLLDAARFFAEAKLFNCVSKPVHKVVEEMLKAKSDEGNGPYLSGCLKTPAFPAFISFGTIAKLFARCIECRIFMVLSFDSSGFPTSGAFGHQVLCQCLEHLAPEFPSFFGAAGLADGMGKLAQRVQGAFETDPFHIHVMAARNLRHQPADQIMPDQGDQQFFFHHGWCFAAQLFDVQGGLQIVQAHFQTPASQIGFEDVARRILLRIQQGGDHYHFTDAKTLLDNASGHHSKRLFPG